MKIILILAALFSFHFSFAGLDGPWTGFGAFKPDGEGEGIGCSSMTMKWVETETSVEIIKGNFDCETVTFSFEKTSWQLKDGLLYDLQGKEVGAYNGIDLAVDLADSSGEGVSHISLVRQGNRYDYQEASMDRNKKIIYTIEGCLFAGGDD
jgi:hypothetical protein